MGFNNRYLFVGTNGPWPELGQFLKYAELRWPAEHYVCSPAVEDTVDQPGWHIVPTVWMWNAARQWNDMFSQVADASDDAILTFIWLRHGATPATVEQLFAPLKRHTTGICLVKQTAGLLATGSLADFAKLPPAQIGKGFFDEHVGNTHLLNELHDRAVHVGVPVLDPTNCASSPAALFGQQKRPFLSASLISKNGAVYLAQCLESLMGAVDDVVVVLDTTTTDDTAAIAEAYGVRVIERQWDGSFANARNVSLRATRGLWTLCIDPDEVLQPGKAPTLRKFLSDQPDSYVWFWLYNYATEGEATGTRANVSRLVPNRETIATAGTVHETLTGEDLPNVLVDDIIIFHYGYMDELNRTKIARNQRYVLAEWEKDPTDPRMSWYLAGTYLAQNNLEAALATVEGVPYGTTPWHLRVMHLQADLYLQRKRTDEALAVLDKLVSTGVSYQPTHILWGHIYLQQNNLQRAKEAYETALATPWDMKVWGRFIVSPQDDQADCLAGLGVVAFRSGDATEALRLLQQAISIAPSGTNPRLGMAEVLTAQGKPREALEHLDKARKRANQGLLLNIAIDSARIYVAMGEPRRANDALASADALQGSPRLVARIAELEGNWAEARKLWDELVQTTGDPLYIAHRALCAIQLRDVPAAVADLEQIMPTGELTTPYGYVPMAMLAELNGNYGEAYQYLREAYSRGEGEVDILLYLGRMAHLAGNAAEANNAARVILSVNPDLPGAVQLYHLTGGVTHYN